MSKATCVVINFVVILLLPLSTLYQIGLGLFMTTLIYTLFAFKETSQLLYTPADHPFIGSPISSQINPFVTSSAEMRTAIEHDIQTPLTKIMAQTEALLLAVPELSKPLLSIGDNARFLSVHTARYFEYFGLQETQLRLDQMTDITEVLRGHLIDYLDAFEDLGISYRFDIPDNPIYIQTEANLLDLALCDILSYVFASIESFKDVRLTLIIRKSTIEINLFIDTDLQTRDALSAWKLFGHQDPSRNSQKGLDHLSIVLANQMIQKHDGLLTVNQYASNTLHYQIKLKNPNSLFL